MLSEKEILIEKQKFLKLLKNKEEYVKKDSKEKGLSVVVRDDESIDSALKRFKKKLKKDNLFETLKNNRYFIKPSKKRKLAKEKGIIKQKLLLKQLNGKK